MTRRPAAPRRSGARREHLASLLHQTFALVEHDVRLGMSSRGYPIEQVYLPVIRGLPLEGSRISEIAERAGLAKQTVGPLVNELERRGIVSVVTDPHDRRARVVRFTPLGLRGLAAGQDAVGDVERRCRKVLGRGGLERLKADLRQVRDALGKRP